MEVANSLIPQSFRCTTSLLTCWGSCTTFIPLFLAMKAIHLWPWLVSSPRKDCFGGMRQGNTNYILEAWCHSISCQIVIVRVIELAILQEIVCLQKETRFVDSNNVVLLQKLLNLSSHFPLVLPETAKSTTSRWTFFFFEELSSLHSP